MANRNVTLKRNNGGTIEALFPTTIVSQLMADDGTTSLFDTNNKLKVAYLPDAVFDSLRFYNVLSGASTNQQLADYLYLAYQDSLLYDRSVIGYYFVINASGTLANITNVYEASGVDVPHTKISCGFIPSDGGSNSTSTDSGVLEVGDWVVVTNAVIDPGVSIVYRLAVVNNSYESASETVKGIVELATATETTTGTSQSLAVTPYGLAQQNFLKTHPTISGAASSVDNSGRTYIQDISLDSYGHVTGITSATETVSQTTATLNGTVTATPSWYAPISPGTSGQILASTAGTPAWQTMTFTLNNSATLTPSWYAPTSVGTARQVLVSSGTGAPTWDDRPKWFYYEGAGEPTGTYSNDLIIDLD